MGTNLTEAEPRTELVRNWWMRAEECLSVVHRFLELRWDYGFAINRLNFAAFYGICAVLAERKIAYDHPHGTRAAFHRELLDTNLVDEQWGAFFDELYQDYRASDFVPYTVFSHEYAEAQLARCRQFLAELRPLVASLE